MRRQKLTGFNSSKWQGILLMCLCMSVTACNAETAVDTQATSAPLTITETAVAEVMLPKLSTLTFNTTARVSDTFIYDILYSDVDEVMLSAEDIELPSGFEADVTVLTDSADTYRRSLMFSNIQAEPGTYEIGIKEGTAKLGTEKATGYSFTIEVLNDSLSNYGYVVYSTSATVVTDAMFTATINIEGVPDGKFVKSSMSIDALELHNCTADINIKKLNGGLSYCIILTDISVIDSMQPCYLEIPTGVLKDIEGSAFPGTKLEFTVQQ